MGFFGLLCCCCSGRRRKYSESVVRYPYAPHGQPALDPTLPTKEHIVETTTKVEEKITPPPDYSVNSLSKGQTVVSSAPDPDDISPSSSDTKKQDEKKDIAARPIKPLPKRRDKEARYSTDDVQLGSYIKATNGQEPKSLLKTPLPASSYEKKEETTTQPFVFSAGNGSLQAQEKTTISSSSSPTTRTKKPLPLRPKPTLSSNPIPPSPSSSSPSAPSSPLSTTLPSSQTTPTPITTTFPPPLPPSPPSPPPTTDPGATCPKCAFPNTLKTTDSTNLNYERPYRLCSNPSCRSWNGFADARGLDPDVLCWCDTPRPMRLVAMNAVDARGRRKAFYSCQYKRCRAWWEYEEGGVVRWFERDVVEDMVMSGGI